VHDTRGLQQQTPWEIVLRHAAGEMSYPAMLDALALWPWSPDRVLDPDCTEPEQFVAGNWHDLDRGAVRFGYLTDDDYDAVLVRIR
jgi:hypothetical protein